jgi:ubiquinone/menaquinone biosynthesis C-methylase UbiE
MWYPSLPDVLRNPYIAAVCGSVALRSEVSSHRVDKDDVKTQEKRLPQPMFPRGLAGRLMLMLMNMGHRSIYENAARALALKPEDDLLEVACGNGYFLKKYASHVRSIAGVDLSELAVQMATKRHRDRIKAGTGDFKRGDASQLPWEDGSFSVVTSMGSFTMFPDPLQALKEMHRVLRPGGRVVVGIEWNAEDGLDHSKEVNEFGMWLWSEDDARAMMQEAGFSDTSISYGKGLKMPKMMMVHALR